MSVKVEIYPQGERSDCSISGAGRRVKWTIYLSPSGYISTLFGHFKSNPVKRAICLQKI